MHSSKTPVLFSITLLLFILFLGGTLNSELIELLYKDNVAIRNGEVWRLLTAGFIHIQFWHIAANIFSLWSTWTILAQKVSESHILATFCLSIMCGTIASFLLIDAPSLGASGGVFGLIGMILVLAQKLNMRQLVQQVYTVLFINIGIGFLGMEFIDNAAHIGGLLSGIILSMYTIQQPTKLHRDTLDSDPI